MNYKVNLTMQTKSDLSSIYKYIAFDLQSVRNAIGILSQLEENISSPDHMPQRFRIYDKEPQKSRNLHIIVADNYLIFYIPNDIDMIVTVIRVFHGSRDIDRQ